MKSSHSCCGTIYFELQGICGDFGVGCGGLDHGEGRWRGLQVTMLVVADKPEMKIEMQ